MQGWLGGSRIVRQPDPSMKRASGGSIMIAIRTSRLRSATASLSSLLDALEPRAMLASTFIGTDVDGDAYTIKLTGNGTASVVTSAGGTSGSISSITLTGTDANSNLSITVKKLNAGDGRVNLDELTGGLLKNIFAGRVDLAADGQITLAGLRRAEMGAIGANAAIDINTAAPTDADRTGLFFGTIDGGTSIHVGARVTNFTTKGISGSGAALTFDRGASDIFSSGDFVATLAASGNAGFPNVFGTIVVRGDFNVRADNTVTDSTSVPGRIGAIIAGSFNAETKVTAEAIGDITARNSGAIRGQWTAGVFGSLNTRGVISGSVNATDQGPIGRSIGLIAAGQLTDLTVNALNGILNITARGAQANSFTAGFINSIVIGNDGLRTSTFSLTGQNANGFSLRRLTDASELNGVTIAAQNAIGEISVFTMVNSQIASGVTTVPASLLPADLTGFGVNSRIDRITVRRGYDAAPGSEAFVNSGVVASTIGRVSINGAIKTDNTAVPFGFGGRVISNVSVKNTTGTKVTPLVPAVAGDFSPFAGSADFLFRVYA